MDFQLQPISPASGIYGTFDRSGVTLKDKAMKTLSGIEHTDKPVRAAIDELFNGDAGEDKKTVLVHFIKATQDRSLFAAIRQIYVDLLNDLNQRARSRPSIDGTPSPGLDLSGTNLSRMHFIGLKLDGADFSNSILHDTHWENMWLTKANFSGAEFKGATLRNVRLWEANLCSVILIGVEKLENVALQEADMTEAQCDGVNLSSTNLMKVDMTGAYLNRAVLDANHSLIEVDFTDAHMIAASLQNTYWENTIVLRTELNGANWTGARLHNMDMGLAIGIDLTGVAQRSDDRTDSRGTKSENCIVS